MVMVTVAVETVLVNPWQQHQVGKQAQHWVLLVMTRQQTTAVVLQLSLEATVTTMGRSTTLAATATGGRQVRAQVPPRGAGPCTITAATWASTAATRRTGYLSAALRTDWTLVEAIDNLLRLFGGAAFF